MATAPTLLTIEQYLRTSYYPDVDYVDGEIEERNLGEFEHGRSQGLISYAFTIHQKSGRQFQSLNSAFAWLQTAYAYAT